MNYKGNNLSFLFDQSKTGSTDSELKTIMSVDENVDFHHVCVGNVH